MNVRDALGTALSEELERDKNVFVIGISAVMPHAITS